MMKVAFASIDLSLTGGNRYIFEVSNRLKARGHDVKILALAGSHEWFKGLNVEVFYKQPNFYKN